MGDWLAILLPGAGYGPVGAVLRLPRLVIEAGGAEVVVLDYPPRHSQEWHTELIREANSQVAREVEAAAARRVTFIAKSLGTAVLAALDPHATASAAVEAIWLTPLFGEATVRAGAIERGWRSLLVAGDGDRYHDPAGHQAVREALAADSLILAGADHLLEVPGDAIATLDRHRQLVEAVIRFCGTEPS